MRQNDLTIQKVEGLMRTNFYYTQKLTQDNYKEISRQFTKEVIYWSQDYQCIIHQWEDDGGSLG